MAVLYLTNKAGSSFFLTEVTDIRRRTQLNQQRELTFTVFPDLGNRFAFQHVACQNWIQFGTDTYIIKTVQQVLRGDKYIKQVTCLQSIFDVMINAAQFNCNWNNRLYSIWDALRFAFEPMYPDPADFAANVQIDPSFEGNNLYFENFGYDNVLSMVNHVCNRWGCEFYYEEGVFYFLPYKGKITNYQFRFGLNLNSFTYTIDTKNQANVIRGMGGNIVNEGQNDAYYEHVYTAIDDSAYTEGWRVGPLVIDQRYQMPGLMNRCHRELEAVLNPEVSVDLTAEQLKEIGGYQLPFPEVGDWGYVVVEPMDNLNVQVRITEIDEAFMDDGPEWVAYDINVKVSNIINRLSDQTAGLQRQSMLVDSVYQRQLDPNPQTVAAAASKTTYIYSSAAEGAGETPDPRERANRIDMEGGNTIHVPAIKMPELPKYRDNVRR